MMMDQMMEFKIVFYGKKAWLQKLNHKEQNQIIT